jgi:hypothetical protein
MRALGTNGRGSFKADQPKRITSNQSIDLEHRRGQLSINIQRLDTIPFVDQDAFKSCQTSSESWRCGVCSVRFLLTNEREEAIRKLEMMGW